MFRESVRVVGATRKFLVGRNISYLDILSAGVALSPKVNMEVEVNPSSVHRFIPDRLISKSSGPAFLSTISFPVRVQMQLNQDFLDNQIYKTRLSWSFLSISLFIVPSSLFAVGSLLVTSRLKL